MQKQLCELMHNYGCDNPPLLFALGNELETIVGLSEPTLRFYSRYFYNEHLDRKPNGKKTKIWLLKEVSFPIREIRDGKQLLGTYTLSFPEQSQAPETVIIGESFAYAGEPMLSALVKAPFVTLWGHISPIKPKKTAEKDTLATKLAQALNERYSL